MALQRNNGKRAITKPRMPFGKGKGKAPAITVTDSDANTFAVLDGEHRDSAIELPLWQEKAPSPNSGFQRQKLYKPQAASQFPSIPEDEEVSHKTSRATLTQILPVAERPRKPNTKKMTVKLWHMSTGLAEWQSETFTWATETVQVKDSTTYHELYQELQLRASKIAFATAGCKPAEVNGTMFIDVWDESHCITWKNWVSTTQHMCGIEGAQLRFEFYVSQQQLYCGRPKVQRNMAGKEIFRGRNDVVMKMRQAWTEKVQKFELRVLEKFESLMSCGPRGWDGDNDEDVLVPNRHAFLTDDYVAPHAFMNQAIRDESRR